MIAIKKWFKQITCKHYKPKYYIWNELKINDGRACVVVTYECKRCGKIASFHLLDDVAEEWIEIMDEPGKVHKL